MTEKERLVLDTTVPVAAIRSEAGASHELLLKALRHEYTLLLSAPLLIEYEAVLSRREHLAASQFTPERISELLDSLSVVAEPVAVAFSWRPSLCDPGDEMVLDVAVNGRADLLVTLNLRDFLPAQQRFGLRVCSPSEALRRLRGRR